MQDPGENVMVLGIYACIYSTAFTEFLLCSRDTEMDKTSKYSALMEFIFWWGRRAINKYNVMVVLSIMKKNKAEDGNREGRGRERKNQSASS